MYTYIYGYVYVYVYLCVYVGRDGVIQLCCDSIKKIKKVDFRVPPKFVRLCVYMKYRIAILAILTLSVCVCDFQEQKKSKISKKNNIQTQSHYLSKSLLYGQLLYKFCIVLISPYPTLSYS